MSASRRIDLCSTDEVAPGAALKVETAGLTLAVFNRRRRVLRDRRQLHAWTRLALGRLHRRRGGRCNFHNGQFNIKTGEVVSPPCMVPIKTYKTLVENGRVLIEINDAEGSLRCKSCPPTA